MHCSKKKSAGIKLTGKGAVIRIDSSPNKLIQLTYRLNFRYKKTDFRRFF